MRAPVSELDGICSGDILVFEPNGDALLPELLPFIVQSEGFFAHALGTSAGSLSPRTRWKDLAKYEFALPPKDEQRRIADILWAADEAHSRSTGSLDAAMVLKRTLMTTLTTRGSKASEQQETPIGHLPKRWEVVTVGDLLSVCQYGLSIPLHEKGQFPIFRMMNFDDGLVVETDMKYVDLTDDDFQSYKVEYGDLLFNRTNSADLVGKVGIYLLDGDHVFASYLVRLRVREERVLPRYLNYYLNSEAGQRRILVYATPGVSQTNINASNLQKVLIPLPPLPEQEEIVRQLEQVGTSKQAVEEHLSRLHEMKGVLLSELLGEH